MNEAGTLVGVVSNVEVVADQQPAINTFSALAGPPCRATRSAPGEHLRCG